MKLPINVIRLSTFTIVVLSLALNSFAIDFDPAFGSGGKFLTLFSSSGQPSSDGSKVFIQPSGRSIVVGSHQEQGTGGAKRGFGLVGLTAGGVLDSSYANGGKLLLWDPGFHRFLISSQILPDGSVLVLADMSQSAEIHRPELYKFTPAGQPDTNFDADVNVRTGETWSVIVVPGSGGKIYLIVRHLNTQFSLVRLNSNGSRDTAFGPEGVRPFNLNRFLQNPTITSLVELDGGRLLLVGTYYDRSFEGLTFVIRLDSDSNIDRSFGTQGAVRIAIPGGSVATAATKIQPDGKILLGGYWTFLGSNTLLMRLTTRGRLDHSFGTRGVVMDSFSGVNGIAGIALAPDGKIIVAGSSGQKALPSNQRLFVMRYSPSGVRESFLVTNFVASDEAGATDIALQPDGKMVISGFTRNVAANATQLASARFTP